ncbi:aldose epimerase family protein [Clostridium sp.]|uniref:aldose epimerase family protein n=1 Tax=Clostridium sp. TaxID=1506 RepID=UPI003C12FEEB
MVIESKINDEISKIILKNDKVYVEILNLGAVIEKINVEDRYGNKENIVLAYKDEESYIENPSSLGAVVGRVAGRIGNGSFKLNDVNYELDKNNNGNCLHGGYKGFSKKIWDYSYNEDEENSIVTFTCFSKDGEGGFPGNLNVKVTYSLEWNKLSIEYRASSDKDTVVNLTNHSYFNLSGNNKRNVLEQKIYIDSDKICELDKNLIPTGIFLSVEKTPFDFREAKNIGEDINKNNLQLEIGSGYDHPWILNKKGDFDLMLVDEVSGRIMKVKTNQKAVLCYSMNFPDELPLENGKVAKKHDGICFETQSLPIGYDDCFLEDIILKKNEEYYQKTTFEFKCI